jgi:hypothetical protein
VSTRLSRQLAVADWRRSLTLIVWMAIVYGWTGPGKNSLILPDIR